MNQSRAAAIATLSVLTESELNEIRVLHAKYLDAHKAENFPLSDSLRSELIQWGAWPPEYGWHPTAEFVPHRQARLIKRIAEAL